MKQDTPPCFTDMPPPDFVINGNNDEYDQQYDLVNREENTKAMLMYFGLSLACIVVVCLAVYFKVTR